MKPILNSLLSSGAILALGSNASPSLLSAAGWHTVRDRVTQSLNEFHRAFPLRAGLPREELKSKLGLPPRVFDAVIERAGSENILAANAGVLRRADFSISFTSEQKKKIDALIMQFEQAPYMPPSAQEAEDALGSETLAALIAQEKLVRLSDAVLLAPRAFAEMRDWVIATIKAKGQVTAADVRDHFNTSRKYAIALLEHLDVTRVTQRVGDARVLR